MSIVFLFGAVYLVSQSKEKQNKESSNSKYEPKEGESTLNWLKRLPKGSKILRVE